MAQRDDVKISPHSLEAEQSVLGGLMLENTAWEKVSEILSIDDFYHPAHRTIFQTLENLSRRDKPFDVLVISESLKSTQELDKVGGESYLFEIVHQTPSAANIQAYAQIVREKSILRKLITAGSGIIESAFNPQNKTAIELLDEAERRVFHIAETQRTFGTGPVHINTLLSKAATHVDQLKESGGAITGLPTGYQDFDEMTSGLQPADLVVIAGRPSMGKTMIAMNIAENAAMKSDKKPVLIFSMEMPGEALALRMISSLGRLDHHRLRTGRLADSDWPRIGSVVNMLSQTKLFIDDTPALTPAELRTRARRLAREHGSLGLIVVDYLQLMQSSNNRDNRVAEISEISRALKTLAKELHVPVIALSQLNRGLEQRPDKRPVMSDLRESGAIEQDADLIAFIYRDEVYHPETTQEKGIAEVIIAKQRNGPIGKVKLTFLGKHMRFENYASDKIIGVPA